MGVDGSIVPSGGDLLGCGCLILVVGAVIGAGALAFAAWLL